MNHSENGSLLILDANDPFPWQAFQESCKDIVFPQSLQICKEVVVRLLNQQANNVYISPEILAKEMDHLHSIFAEKSVY